MRYRLAVATLSVALIACDKSTDPPTATSLVANSSVNISATVGSAVSPSPSVIVKDQRGSPMAGVVVTFTATAGAGTVTGATATTGPDGVATVGSWILGGAVGQNVLTASSGTLPSVTFTAAAAAGPPSVVAKVAGDDATAVVGSTLASPPSVSVKDAFGNPIAGVNVVFTIGLGAGSLTNATRTTGTDGIATVGSWTLGTVSTTNTVVATAGSLAPVTFTATALPGPAARVVVAAGNGQTGRAGVITQQAISARVTDSFDNGILSVPIAFAVTQGGGVIVGPATVTSNGQGVSTLPGGWILGPVPGTNLMTATVVGVGTATFTATGTPNVCTELPHAVGTTASGQLNSSDCQFPDGSSVDYYNVPVPAQSAFEFLHKSSVFDAYLYITDGAALPVIYAENDDDDVSTNSRIRILAPAGSTLHVGAGSYSPGEAGAYQLSSSVLSESEEQCDLTFVLAGVVTAQSLAVTDCIYSFNSALNADLFAIKIRAGTTMTFHMSSTSSVDPYLELYGGENGDLLAQNDNVSGTTKDAEIRYTAPATGYFYIAARPAVAGQFGAYGLSIVLNTSASSLRMNDAVTETRRPAKKRIKVPWSAGH